MSVSAGSSASDDVTLAITGGGNFSTRLEQFITARQAAEDAYTNLQIGQDARAEYDKAAALTAGAQKALVDAKAAAAGLVQEAQDKAATIINEANAAALVIRTEANDLRSTAAALRNDISGQLDAAKATAQKQADDAVKAAAETQAKWSELAAQQIALGAQMQAAADAETRWSAAVAALKSMIEKV